MSLRTLTWLVASITLGCSTNDTVKECNNDGGCPLAYGTACDDPSCAAAYACTNGGWVLDHVCAVREAGPDTSVIVDAGVRDVDIDVPGANGGPGCNSLVPPDCTLAAGAACPNGCCGCEDLFVCQNGGWNVWGYCSDGGIFKN
jgi:hypothetical protein